MQPKIYGDCFVTTAPTEEMAAGHIGGCLLRYGQDGRPASLEIHAGSPSQPQKVHLSFGDAMFLLGVLKAIQLDHNIQFPDDPRR